MSSQKPPRRAKEHWTKTVPMAPVGLDSVQDFVNTEDRTAGTEILDSVENLGLWLAKWGLAPRGTELTPADLERMLHLRRDLRRWIAGGRTGRMDPAVAERLTRWWVVVGVPIASELVGCIG